MKGFWRGFLQVDLSPFWQGFWQGVSSPAPYAFCGVIAILLGITFNSLVMIALSTFFWFVALLLYEIEKNNDK